MSRGPVGAVARVGGFGCFEIDGVGTVECQLFNLNLAIEVVRLKISWGCGAVGESLENVGSTKEL